MKVRVLLLVVLLSVATLFGTSPKKEVAVAEAATPVTFGVGPLQPYRVPAGVTRLLVEARGGRGGIPAAVAGCAPLAGVGHQVTTILAVTPGTTLFVFVGGNGTPPFGGINGGGLGGTHLNPEQVGAGGGGASDIRLSALTTSRLVVAAGGGGAGACPNVGGGSGGNGGDAGQPGGNGTPAGAGGGGGQPGTQVAGGAPGTTFFGPGTAGTAFGGGSGGGGLGLTTRSGSGGGGGGGYFGGGGGGAGQAGAQTGGGGGGGGGSSFVDPALTSNTTIVPHPDGQASVGRVVITPLDALSIAKTFAPASVQVNVASQMTITVTNGNPFPLTNVAFTDTLPSGLTINTTVPPTGSPYCGSLGTVNITATTISLASGSLAAAASCQIRVSVSSATPGSFMNTTSQVTSTESSPGAIASATLTVTALPAPTATASPPPMILVPPVIPQVFQRAPQGIFHGNRATPTPIVRAAAAPVGAVPAGMPVLRPPSTGDAGIKHEVAN